METITEFLQQHSINNEDDDEEENSKLFLLAFVMDMEGQVRIDMDWPDDIPTEILGPAMASLLLRVNKGLLEGSCLQLLSEQMGTPEDNIRLSSIIAAYEMLAERMRNNETIDPTKVFRIDRSDEFE